MNMVFHDVRATSIIYSLFGSLEVRGRYLQNNHAMYLDLALDLFIERSIPPLSDGAGWQVVKIFVAMTRQFDGNCVDRYAE